MPSTTTRAPGGSLVTTRTGLIVAADEASAGGTATGAGGCGDTGACGASSWADARVVAADSGARAAAGGAPGTVDAASRFHSSNVVRPTTAISSTTVTPQELRGSTGSMGTGTGASCGASGSASSSCARATF